VVVDGLHSEVQLDFGAVRLAHIMLVMFVLEEENQRKCRLVSFLWVATWVELAKDHMNVIKIARVIDLLMVWSKDLGSYFHARFKRVKVEVVD
jgi:hypothetical protein